MDFRIIFKVCITSITANAIFLLGGWDKFIKALLFFMIVDYLTGILVAYKRKKLKSKVGFDGILKKGMMILMVLMGVQLDILLDSEDFVARNIVIAFYLCNEGISILENFRSYGVKFPSIIEKLINSLDKSESEDDRETFDYGELAKEIMKRRYEDEEDDNEGGSTDVRDNKK